MRGPYQILMPLLSLFFCRVDLTDLFPLNYQVKLIRLLDADTAKVNLNGQVLSVRLDKIDAAEKGQPLIGGKGDAGLIALNCAEEVLKQKHKVAMNLQIKGFDRYGRILGDLDNLSFHLVEAGCVSLYPQAYFSSRQEKTYFLKVLYKAREHRIGLWSQGGYQRPQLWRKSQFKPKKRALSAPFKS
jgi:endonuclease YncB( thermonuclease family)